MKIELWNLLSPPVKKLIDKETIALFVSDDATIVELIKKTLKFYHQFIPLLSSEITVDWIENDLKGYDLFGPKKFLILNLDVLKKDLLIRFSDALLHTPHHVFMISHKSIPNLKNLKNEVIIETPKFWQFDKVLEFFSRILKVSLHPSGAQRLMEVLPKRCYDFYQALKKIQLLILADESQLNEKKLISIDKNFIDQYFFIEEIPKFEFIEALNNKDYEKFFNGLYQFIDYEQELKSNLGFFLSHLNKIAESLFKDGLVIPNQSSMSKYEKEITLAAKRWSKVELVNMVNILEEWEYNLRLDCDLFRLKLQSKLLSR